MNSLTGSIKYFCSVLFYSQVVRGSILLLKPSMNITVTVTLWKPEVSRPSDLHFSCTHVYLDMFESNLFQCFAPLKMCTCVNDKLMKTHCSVESCKRFSCLFKMKLFYSYGPLPAFHILFRCFQIECDMRRRNSCDQTPAFQSPNVCQRQRG